MLLTPLAALTSDMPKTRRMLTCRHLHRHILSFRNAIYPLFAEEAPGFEEWCAPGRPQAGACPSA